MCSVREIDYSGRLLFTTFIKIGSNHMTDKWSDNHVNVKILKLIKKSLKNYFNLKLSLQ